MRGIKFIVDDTGEKTAVVIDLKQWGKLWEEFYARFLDNSPENERETSEALEEKIDRSLNTPKLSPDIGQKDYQKVAEAKGILKDKKSALMAHLESVRQEWEE